MNLTLREASAASYFDVSLAGTTTTILNVCNQMWFALAPFMAYSANPAGTPGNPNTYFNSTIQPFFLRGGWSGGLDFIDLITWFPKNNALDTGSVNDLSNG